MCKNMSSTAIREFYKEVMATNNYFIITLSIIIRYYELIQICFEIICGAVGCNARNFYFILHMYIITETILYNIYCK